MITGVLGRGWRATVTPSGDIDLPDGPPLAWHIAADDRWHSPHREPSVRQRRIDGTPVTETRVRIPRGDAVQRVWSLADHGGLTMVEVRNDSPLPIAVAFTRGDLLSTRPPTTVPVEGIDLPAGTVTFPIGHAATVVVAVAHDGSAGTLPGGLTGSDDAVRAWVSMASRASVLELPDRQMVDAVVAARCDASLAADRAWGDEPVAALVAAGERARMGEKLDDELPELAAAVERVLRTTRTPGWTEWAAVRSAAVVLRSTGQRRALDDLRAAVRRWPSVVDDSVTTTDMPTDITVVPWVEGQLTVARRGSTERTVDLLPTGYAEQWLGANLEAHHIDVSDLHDDTLHVGWGIRWHGARPAVLWEQQGSPARLCAPVAAPAWSSADSSGETLWPVPPNAADIAAGIAARSGS